MKTEGSKKVRMANRIEKRSGGLYSILRTTEDVKIDFMTGYMHH